MPKAELAAKAGETPSGKSKASKGFTAIIAEKPSAAKRIAEVLSDGNYVEHEIGGVSFYEFNIGKKKYRSIPAVGHLFSLKQEGKGWDYPRFDARWIPSYKASRKSAFSRKYFEAMEKALNGAKDFIIATDYDEEGEVIGLNILRFMAGRDNAKRMKFSTMTKQELKKAFDEMSDSIDFKQAESGLTRHFLDWYYGINSSRALTLAVKKIGERFKILSAGRVQGPVLVMLAEKEKEIQSFKPETFWEMKAELRIGRRKFEASYKKNPIKDAKEAERLRKIKFSEGRVSSIRERIGYQKPPVPYDTTTFLSDASRYFGYTPKQALDIAESLYQKGYISYPRTSSQVLPPGLDLRDILKKISGIPEYSSAASKILKGDVKPNNGKKTDPAHPAIYPTGEIPKSLSPRERKVYDLVVRRFLAVFGEPAKRKTITVEIESEGEVFVLKGRKTLEKGWTEFYGKYVKYDEVELPSLKEGDKVRISKTVVEEKQTQPPPRYSPSSVLKEMDKRGLGTKATRASILQTLYDRGYIMGKSIEVTDLGMKVAEILKRHIPELVSEDLTRRFEEKTDEIYQGKETMENVLEDARKELEKIFRKFKKKEDEIGKELTEALKETQEKSSILGPCPNCKGGTLKIFFSWRTKKRFAGCSNYPDCKTGFPLPRLGRIEPTGKSCQECKTPIIRVYRSGKRPFQMCLDPECKTKEDWGKQGK